MPAMVRPRKTSRATSRSRGGGAMSSMLRTSSDASRTADITPMIARRSAGVSPASIGRLGRWRKCRRAGRPSGAGGTPALQSRLQLLADLQMLHRRGLVPAALVDAGEVVVRVVVVRFERDHLLVHLGCLREPPEVLERD